jgi:death on curing protein
MRYLTVSELIYINGSVLGNDQIRSGKQKVRDVELLQSAAMRPLTSVFGADAYTTLPEKVAALFHSLVRNHPFTDGNKRTAAVAAVLMFRVNGWRVIWQQEQALDVILAAAEGRTDLHTLAKWFPVEAEGDEQTQDAARDMALIGAIIEEQRWLLDELERR